MPRIRVCLWLKGAYLSRTSQRVIAITAFAKIFPFWSFFEHDDIRHRAHSNLLGACIGVFSIALVAVAARPNRRPRDKGSRAGHARLSGSTLHRKLPTFSPRRLQGPFIT